MEADDLFLIKHMPTLWDCFSIIYWIILYSWSALSTSGDIWKMNERKTRHSFNLFQDWVKDFIDWEINIKYRSSQIKTCSNTSFYAPLSLIKSMETLCRTLILKTIPKYRFRMESFLFRWVPHPSHGEGGGWERGCRGLTAAAIWAVNCLERLQSHQAPAGGAPGGAEPKAQMMMGWNSCPISLRA